MMKHLREFFDMVKTAFIEWNEDGAPRLAAALAYHTAFSVAPLLVIITAILGFIVSGQSVRSDILSEVQRTLGPDAAELISNLIDNLSEPRQGIISTLLGVGALLFGALGVFNNLQISLDIIWGVEPSQRNPGVKGFIKDKLLAFGMMLVVGFLLIVSLVISTLIPILSSYVLNPLPGTETFVQLINILISFGVVTLLFALIYRFLPHVHIEWRDVWVGAAVTSLLFSVGQTVLSAYLSNSTLLSPYGAAGAFVVILLWIYYSAQIVLFGAEFTQVYARRYGSNIVPSFTTSDDADTGRSDQHEAATA